MSIIVDDVDVDFSLMLNRPNKNYSEEVPGTFLPVYDYGMRKEFKGMKVLRPTAECNKAMRAAINQFGEPRAQAALQERLLLCFLEDPKDVIQHLDSKHFIERFTPDMLGSDVALLGNGLAMTPRGMEIIIYQLKSRRNITTLDLRQFGRCLPSLKYLAKYLPNSGLQKVYIGRPITELEAKWLVDAIQTIKFVEHECLKMISKKEMLITATIADEDMTYHAPSRAFELVLPDPQSYRLLVANMTDRGVALQDALKYAYKGLSLVNASRTPVDPTVHRALWCLAGRARRRELKDYDGSIADLYQALKIDKNYLAAIIDMGITFESKKDYTTALKWYEKATEVAPEKSNVWYNLSCVCYEIWKISHKREFLQKGIHCMRISIKKKPDRSDKLLREMLFKLGSC